MPKPKERDAYISPKKNPADARRTGQPIEAELAVKAEQEWDEQRTQYEQHSTPDEQRSVEGVEQGVEPIKETIHP